MNSYGLTQELLSNGNIHIGYTQGFQIETLGIGELIEGKQRRSNSQSTIIQSSTWTTSTEFVLCWKLSQSTIIQSSTWTGSFRINLKSNYLGTNRQK